jgi:hypothetical protein
MTINKNSWHYKLCAKMVWSVNGDHPARTNLCRYFWTVIFSLFMVVVIALTVAALAVLCAIMVMPILMLGYLLGFKLCKNSQIALRYGFINGRKVYPVHVWAALIIGGVLAWLGSKPSLLVWLTLSVAAAGALWVWWLSLGLKREEDSGKFVMTHVYLGKYRVYPFLFWASLMLVGAFGFIFWRWGELGLIKALTMLISLPLAAYSIDRFFTWHDERHERYKEYVKLIKPPAPRREEPGIWSVIRAYLKACKDKVCPIVTFNEEPTNLEI